MNTRDRRTKQEYALLLCGEFFRDELITPELLRPHYREKFEEFKQLCFDALNDPTVKDAHDIRTLHAELTATE